MSTTIEPAVFAGFTTKMNVTTTEINPTLAGGWGDQPLQVLYAVGGGANFALAFVHSISPENINQPAYILNLGSRSNYSGGSLHNLPGQTPVEPSHGHNFFGAYEAGMLVSAGEQITLQLGNAGSFILNMTVYEFSPA